MNQFSLENISTYLTSLKILLNNIANPTYTQVAEFLQIHNEDYLQDLLELLKTNGCITYKATSKCLTNLQVLQVNFVPELETNAGFVYKHQNSYRIFWYDKDLAKDSTFWQGEYWEAYRTLKENTTTPKMTM